MPRFKKMDCWQEWNFPFSKSPIGFHTLQGFFKYSREIGGGLWEWSYWPLSKLKHISGSGHCLRWLCSWILILLDEILQYNRIWQFSYGRRPSLMTRVAHGPTHPPTSTQCRMDGVWTGNSFWSYSYPIPVRVIQQPNTGTFTFLREAPKGNAATATSVPRRIIQKTPFHLREWDLVVATIHVRFGLRDPDIV